MYQPMRARKGKCLSQGHRASYNLDSKPNQALPYEKGGDGEGRGDERCVPFLPLWEREENLTGYYSVLEPAGQS